MLRKAALIFCVFVFLAGCSSGYKAPKTETPQLEQPAKGETVAIMKTSLGDIKIKFFPQEAPKAVENFIRLSQKGYYDGITFHRVINDFMIQGGDPTAAGTGGESIWKKDFEDEFSEKIHHFRGALSMANKGPNTNSSQFFIVQDPKVGDDVIEEVKQGGFSQELIDRYVKNGGEPRLDNGFTIFGQVYEGMDIVDKIAAVETNEDDKPLEDVTIKSVEITTLK